MKKILGLLLIIMSLLLVGCQQQVDDTVFHITLSNEVKTLYVGDTYVLTTNALKLNLTDEVTWTSSNEEILSVDQGVLSALAVGEATIEAHCGELLDTMDFVVEEVVIPATIIINGPQTVDIGTTIELSATISNHSGNDQLLWTSSNHDIASVSTSGIVTGYQTGLVTIRATLYVDQSVYCDYLVYVRYNLDEISTIVNQIISTSYQLNGSYDLTGLNTTITDLVASTKDSVVGVSNYQYDSVSHTYNLASIGSGAIYYRTNVGPNYTYRVITNHHVIEDNSYIKIYLGYLDQEISGTVIKSNDVYDLAIVEFTTTLIFTPLTLGTLEDVHIGDFVVALGNPTGYEYFGSATLGIISHGDRFAGGNEPHLIQHDAAINPGNSGGPLFALNGHIIGINTLKLVSSDIDNMGFAVSIQTILDFINQ